MHIFLIFFNLKVCCVFSLELPHRGNSNEYKQYTIFNMNKKKHLKLSQICSYGSFSKGLKTELETAVVNEPSVFEPLKFYCIFLPDFPSNRLFWRLSQILFERID